MQLAPIRGYLWLLPVLSSLVDTLKAFVISILHVKHALTWIACCASMLVRRPLEYSHLDVATSMVHESTESSLLRIVRHERMSSIGMHDLNAHLK